MKTLALGDLKRNKPKDAYDIYMVLSHADYRKIQSEFQGLLKDSKEPDSLAHRCLSIWGDFFDSPKGKGVNDVVSFFLTKTQMALHASAKKLINLCIN